MNEADAHRATELSKHKTSRLNWLILAFGVFLVGVIVTTATLYLYGKRTDKLDDAMVDLRRVNILLLEQTERVYDSVDFLLQATVAKMKDKGFHGASNEKRLHDLLKSFIAGTPHISGVSVLDSDGFTIATTFVYPTTNPDYSDRKYFQTLKNNPVDIMVIDDPVRRKSNDKQWLLNVARPVLLPGGIFDGVVVVSMVPEYFNSLYQSLDLLEGSYVSMLRDDSMLMLRSPPKDEAIGKIFGRNPALHPFLEQRLPDVSINIFSHISKANVLVNCRFAKRHPIYVCTSMVEENLLAGWEKDKLNIAIISVLICVLIITLLFVLSRQVTAREIAVINAEKAKEEADAASAAKSEFLAAMSHDLRTPLNAIMGFAEMMELRTFGKLGDIHYERYAKDIHESGKLLVSLINDVLDLSKVEAGKYELHEENIDINNHISSTIKMISPQANNKRIKLITVNNTENMILRADERVMTQVLNNLLSNAIKFTPRGGDVTVTSATDTSSKFSITIGDTGIGMSQENIDRAMQPFEQANNNHAQNHEGTGLGLHLCKHFMKLHGGTLEIKSEINVGTQVTINFPTERTVRSK